MLRQFTAATALVSAFDSCNVLANRRVTHNCLLLAKLQAPWLHVIACLLEFICLFAVGQEREQVSGRASEVVDTKERIVEVTQPNPCGGVPTGAGGIGGVTGSTGTGAGYGTGTSGTGHKGQQ